MFTLKKILVPTDFSAESAKALRYASLLAEQFGATICLINVVETPSFISDMDNVYVLPSEESRAGDARTRLIKLAREKIDELIPVNPQVRVGTPFQEIVKAAKALQTDVIVIATHGYTGLKHVLLGSTAERVVRHAPCPVLVVR